MLNKKILLENHFNLYILLKDKIIFENELEKNNIEYYFQNESEPIFENKIKYFVRDVDKISIDNILIKNKIIAGTETIRVLDYRDGKKIFKIYLGIALIILAVMLLIILIGK